MKVESVYLGYKHFGLKLLAKTKLREIVVWDIPDALTEHFELVKKISVSNKDAILNLKHEDEVVRRFAEIKIYEFPDIEIEVRDIKTLQSESIHHASQLL